jgi:hypothetical protein
MNRIGTLTLLLAILCGCTPAASTGAPAKPNPFPVVEEVQPLPGRRPLVVHSPVAFEIVADGDWELSLQPMPRGGQPAFKGTGDDVSPYFDPPPPATWSIAHSGEAGFVVYAHCLGGGSLLVADQTGAVQDARPIEFARGPCFWEVRADGAWSLAPTS